jgi:predicted transcriptional regulator
MSQQYRHFIREILDEKGMSVAELIRRAEIGYATGYGLVNDPHRHASTRTFHRIANAADVPFVSLFGGKKSCE